MGAVTGIEPEVVDFTEQMKVTIMRVQETKWKGSIAKELLGNGFKLFNILGQMEVGAKLMLS